MANETGTVKQETGSNLTPIIIIGVILLATIGGIYIIMNSGGDKEGAGTNVASTSSNGSTTNTTPPDTTVPNYSNAPAGATPANFKGSESSAVIVEEFADFQCGTCGVVHPKMKELMAQYGNRVKFVFRNYPLTQVHPKAYDAAVAAEAAGIQGKFWEMQNLLFTNQGNWINSPNHRQAFEGYAKTLGLNIDKYSSDILALPTKQRVDNDMARGRALNITSTPSVLINGKLVPFAQVEVASMSKLIDAEIERVKPRDETQTKSTDASADKKDGSSDKEEKPEK